MKKKVGGFVATVLKEKIYRLNQEHIRSRIREAASDPAYLQDVQEIFDAFSGPEKEGI